ncbi:MAG: putative cadmium-transporting ATPase [Symbiobacteriaceae bacterium]|jgi:Cd2+/Zn2+-exporting ATPase|nr:putative cadmium-transporting ATPase [Symbiobacteriaceae bacterium]
MTAEHAHGRPPELEEGSCATVALTVLKGQRGLIAAELDSANSQINLRYDPGLTDDAQAQQVADEVAARLALHRQNCPGEGGAHCATCMVHMNEMLAASDRVTELNPERVVLKLGPEAPAAREVTRPMGQVSAAAPATPHEEEEVRPLLISTVLCAIFLAAGYIAAKMGASAYIYIPLYAVSYATGGYFRLIEGFQALVKEKNLDINFLMLLGAAGAAVLGKWEEGAMLMFLFTLSATLEAFAVGRTRSAIRKLMALAPEDALVRRAGAELRVPVDQIRSGDTVIVGPGERIAADGEILKGSSAMNEAAITGESIPVEKGSGDKVFAGTVNGHGVIEFVVTKKAGETTLSRIIRVVEEAQAQKAATQRLTDWIDQYYTLIVISVAGLAWVVPPLAGWDDWSGSFYRAMMLLVVASPCALVISTPAAILSGIARAARAGILFKGGLHLEQAARIQVVAMDKTGTLTTGRPGVVEVLAEDGVDETEMFRLAAVVESRSEHPLAAAVLRSAKEQGISYSKPEEFQALAGVGAKAVVDGREAYVGAPRLLQHLGILPSETVRVRLDALYESGLTSMVVVYDGKLLGILGLADTPRAEARIALEHMRKIGIKKIVMLTGDNRRAAENVAQVVGVDEVHAELLPEDKLRLISELEARYGPVAMVGDGVNDAPALARATIGIAMGGVGSDVAMETADVVLMADELEKIAEAIGLARRARGIVLQNLTFAVGVISTLVVLTLIGGLNLPLAVIGHEGSTILVAFNGLRLLVTRLRVG